MRVAIIGGYGKMGLWLASFLIQDGNQVVIGGRNKKRLLEAKQQLVRVEVASNIEAVNNSDIIIVSVPIDNFDNVIEEIAPYISSKQIIIDITSIKVMPVDTLHKYIKTGLVLGTHPMFGPDALSLKNQNIVLTPTDDNETALAQKVRTYLENKGARVTLMTPREHDEIITVVLGLSHYIALVTADTLLQFDKLDKTRAIAGTSYKALLTFVEGVVSRDPEFYASLQMSLPYLTDIAGIFQRSSKTWADFVRNKDKSGFTQRMMQLKEKLKKSNAGIDNAYVNMYRLMED